VKLTDDFDGSDADETVRFALDGKSYEIDVNRLNAARLREALKPFIERARTGNQSRPRPVRAPRRPAPAEKTLYSQLADDEKARFRAWANMGTARRISDARVKSWNEAGRP
jgi:Lsr2